MSDPIREALEAATAEADEWMRDAAGRRCLPRADQMERMTAAAIAAFHRHRAADLFRRNWPGIAQDHLDIAAAAVERAAQGGGDGRG